MKNLKYVDIIASAESVCKCRFTISAYSTAKTLRGAINQLARYIAENIDADEGQAWYVHTNQEAAEMVERRAPEIAGRGRFIIAEEIIPDDPDDEWFEGRWDKSGCCWYIQARLAVRKKSDNLWKQEAFEEAREMAEQVVSIDDTAYWELVTFLSNNQIEFSRNEDLGKIYVGTYLVDLNANRRTA